MKIVIIGAGGRLGSALTREYREKFEVAGFNRSQLDLADHQRMVDVIAPIEFDLLINAAALTNVDYCETHRDKAFQINAAAPRVLAEICGEKNAKLIHISTDYVFDGEKREPYREEDLARPISVYGESKCAGEENVLATDNRHLVIRVSWVFGPDRPSFIDAMIDRARESETVEAIADKFATPTYTRDIAAAIQLVARCADHSGSGAVRGAGINAAGYSGILHFANAGECSWQQYAQHALDCCIKSGVRLKATKVVRLKLRDMKNFVACRPVYSVLSTAKYSAVTGKTPRPWQESVADYIRESVPR